MNPQKITQKISDDNPGEPYTEAWGWGDHKLGQDVEGPLK